MFFIGFFKLEFQLGFLLRTARLSARVRLWHVPPRLVLRDEEPGGDADLCAAAHLRRLHQLLHDWLQQGRGRLSLPHRRRYCHLLHWSVLRFVFVYFKILSSFTKTFYCCSQDTLYRVCATTPTSPSPLDRRSSFHCSSWAASTSTASEFEEIQEPFFNLFFTLNFLELCQASSLGRRTSPGSTTVLTC